MRRWRLQTLGQLQLDGPGGAGIAYPQMGLIALAYLKTAGLASVPRAELARLLWGETDPPQAYANLRKSASRILSRQAEISLDLLSFSKSAVALGPDGDLLEVDTLFTRDPVTGPQAAERNASLLREVFLRDVRTQSKALAAWIEREREAHLAHLRHCVLGAGIVEDEPVNRSIKDAAIKLLEHNPEDEVIRSLLRGTMYKKAASVAVTTEPSHLPGDASLPDRHTHPRLVLLPPLPGDADKENTALASALIEDVTIGLCAMRSISVIAPYSAAKIRHQTDKAAAYERYAISYILDTKLTREGNHYSLFAQLIFFGSDEVIWAERFDLEGAALITSRRELAQRLASAITQQIHAREPLRGKYEYAPEVYRHFLGGQSHLMKLGLPQVRRARRNFREALQLDPAFAPAQSGLSRGYFLEWLITARNDRRLLASAEEHAMTAINADPDLPAGYKELGVAKLYLRQFEESAGFFETAEALSPQYANLIASFGDALIQGSRPAEGLKKVEHAIDLNPVAPDEYFWTAAGACYSLGRYEDALIYIGRMEDRTPADRLSAATWAMLGDQRKARQFVRKTFDVHPGFDLETWMALVPFKEEWQREHYREGLVKAGF